MPLVDHGRGEWVVMAILIHSISGGKIIEEWSANSVSLILEHLKQELRKRERVDYHLLL